MMTKDERFEFLRKANECLSEARKFLNDATEDWEEKRFACDQNQASPNENRQAQFYEIGYEAAFTGIGELKITVSELKALLGKIKDDNTNKYRPRSQN